MKKVTNELQNEIRSIKSIEAYLEKNAKELVTENNISNLLKDMISEKSLKKSDVIKKAGLNEIYGYQIFSGKREPSRDKIIALCFGMGLNVDEVQTILKHSQNPILYARDTRDSIIIFCIENKKDIIECNNMLYDYGFELL